MQTMDFEEYSVLSGSSSAIVMHRASCIMHVKVGACELDLRPLLLPRPRAKPNGGSANTDLRD